MGNRARDTYVIATTWSKGAISQHFIAQARHLRAQGHEVIVLTDQDRTIKDPELEVLTWPSTRPTRLRDALFFFRLARRRRPTHLIANFGATNVMTVMGLLVRAPHRIAWHHTLRAALPKARLKEQRKRLVYALATEIRCPSEAAKRDVVAMGVPASKVSVEYLTLRDPNLQPMERDGFVCVGRLHPSKGQDIIVRTLALLPEAHVEFIGEGEERGRLEKLARSLGVSDRCRFSGLRAHDYVLPRMAASLATLVPSRAEAFGMVAVESLSVGTPVIASRTGGLAEIVADGMNGFLVEPGDVQGFAEAMKGVGHEMGENARRSFLERFDQSWTPL